MFEGLLGAKYDAWLTTDPNDKPGVEDTICPYCNALHKCKWYYHGTEDECPKVQDEIDYDGPDPDEEREWYAERQFQRGDRTLI